MYFLAYIINLAVDIFIGIIIIQVAISWLIVFDVINVENKQARKLIKLLHKVTDPVYKPIKKYVPPIGGIDLTPLIVILGLSFLREALLRALYY